MNFLALLLLLFFNTSFTDVPQTNNPKTQGSDIIQNLVQPTTFADIVEPLIPAVVNIYTEQSNKNNVPTVPFDGFKDLFRYFDIPFSLDEVYSNPQAVSLGSGFIIDKEGYIVTNHHVIDKADKIRVKLYDGSELKASIVGSDLKTDLALLKISANKDLPCVHLGDDHQSRIGDWIIAIGNPFGFDHTVTKGIISSKSRNLDFDTTSVVDNYIQTDAPINRGNSGGPMFNLNGQVIGVTTSIYSPSGSNVGIGFAIPSQTVKKIIYQIKNFGKVNRSILNITISPLTPDLADALGLKKNQKGVIVNSVEHGGAGEKAGLKAGDIILSFNDKPVNSIRELQILVAAAEINSTAKIKVLRKGKKVDLSTKMDLDLSKESVSNDSKQLLSSEVEINGVVFSNITDKNLDPNTKGVMVSKVLPYSIWRSHVKHGDIIIEVNQEEIADINTLEKICSAAKQDKKNLVFLVKRKGANLFIILPNEKIIR